MLGLDRFLGLFGTDIISLQGKLEKLGLYFRAAFNWKFAATGLRGALKDVDARLAKERQRGPTADARAKNRDDERKAEYDALAKRREEEAAKDDAAIDEIRKKRDDARKRALGEEKKSDEESASTLKDFKKTIQDAVDNGETAVSGAESSQQKETKAAATLGTFSAALLGQMGVGTQTDSADRTAKATEQTALNTGVIAAAMAEGAGNGKVVNTPAIDTAAMEAGVAAATAAAEPSVLSGGATDDPVVAKLAQAISILMEQSRTLTSIDRKTGDAAMAFT